MSENLLNEVTQFAKQFVPTERTTFAVALTKSGRLLKSVFIHAMVDSACLCAETGCISEATKLKDPITHTLCVAYDPTMTAPRVLPACGVCQERLAKFGMDVLIGIPNGTGGVDFRTLKELRPYYWVEYW